MPKLILLEDSGVGKSCIVLRFVHGQFDPTSKVRVGASFLSQTIALQDSTMVKFEIWDTAGQERYAALVPLYYRGATVAIVVYDITNPHSFHNSHYWVKELQKHGSPDIVLALVGNKADLQDNREVSVQVAAKNGGGWRQSILTHCITCKDPHPTLSLTSNFNLHNKKI